MKLQTGRILVVSLLAAGAAAFGSAFTLNIDSSGTYDQSPQPNSDLLWTYTSTTVANTSSAPADRVVFVMANLVASKDRVVKSGTFTLYTWLANNSGSNPPDKWTLTGTFYDIVTAADRNSFSGSFRVNTGTGSLETLEELLGTGGGRVGRFSGGSMIPGMSAGTLHFSAESVPEPFTMALCAGALALALRRRLRKA